MVKWLVVIMMAKTTDVEAFYAYIDAVAGAAKETLGITYLEGVNDALDYLLDDTVKRDIDDALLATYHQAKASVRDRAFEKETVRKAVQLALLRGFKDARITNAQMTPDSIGMFIAYLVDRLYPNENPKTVFDPLIGTANMAVTMALQLDTPMRIVGVDDDWLMCTLARNLCDAMDIENQVFHQNTVTYEGGAFDLIVTDFPPHKLDDPLGYFPYPVILHHLDHLREGGYFIALIENDFFSQKKHTLFREKLMEKAHLFGLVKLDETMFTTHPKSVLIVKKKVDKDETKDDFLLVDLPPFTDEEAFQKALVNMNHWFQKKARDVQ